MQMIQSVFWLLWFFITVFLSAKIGLFFLVQVFIPILYNLPITLYLICWRKMRLVAIFFPLYSSTLWTGLFLVGSFGLGYCCSGIVLWLVSNSWFAWGETVGWWFALVQFIATLVVPTIRAEYQESYWKYMTRFLIVSPEFASSNSCKESTSVPEASLVQPIERRDETSDQIWQTIKDQAPANLIEIGLEHLTTERFNMIANQVLLDSPNPAHHKLVRPYPGSSKIVPHRKILRRLKRPKYSADKYRKCINLSIKRVAEKVPDISEDFQDYAILGAIKIARGTVGEADFSKQMIEDFGESLRPHIENLYEAAKVYYDEQFAPKFGLPTASEIEAEDYIASSIEDTKSKPFPK